MPEVVITADILEQRPSPALSATSDFPGAETPAPEPAPEPANAPKSAPEGETPATEEAPAEGAESEAEPQGEGEQANAAAEPVASKKPGINERFADLTKQREEARAEAKSANDRAVRLEENQRRLEETVSDLTKKLAPPEPPPIVAQPRPVREAFDTPDAYDDALVAWGKNEAKREQQIAQTEQDQHAKSQKETEDRAAAERTTAEIFTSVQTAHNARRTAALEKMPDYAEVAERDDLQISLPMATAIMQSDDGPAAAYYLGKNPEIAAKIAGMVVPGETFPAGHPFAGHPVPDHARQLIEMGKVFAAVAQPEVEAKPDPKPLPAPITPLRRGSNSAVTKSLEEIGNEGTMDDYAAKRMPTLRAERSPGFFGGSGSRPN